MRIVVARRAVVDVLVLRGDLGEILFGVPARVGSRPCSRKGWLSARRMT
jgi:hypothetical protein